MGPGAQQERTLLAWQRTALSLLTAAGVLARFSFERLGPWALAPLVVAIPVTASVLCQGHRGSARSPDRGSRPQDNGAPLLITLLVSVLAVVTLAHVLVGE